MLNAIKSLKRLKLLTFLIIFQLALGISLINNVVNQNTSNIENRKIFNRIFDINNTYRIRITSDTGIEPPQGTEGKLYEISNELYKLKSDNKIKNIYSYGSFPCTFEEIDKVGYEIYKDIANKPGETLNSYVNNIIVDENFIDRYSIEVDEGRTLESNDFYINFSKECIPILLGSSYKKDFKIGDIFSKEIFIGVDEKGNISEKTLKNVDFKVVGFIKDYSLITFGSKTTDFGAVRYSNGIVVTPFINNSFEFGRPVVLNDLGLFIELNDNSTINNLQEELNVLLSRLDTDNVYKLKYTVEDMSESLQNIDQSMKHDVNVVLILGAILTSLSIVGITTTILGELEQRRKEFGVKIAHGCDNKTLCKEIIYEVGLMITVSIIISNIYLKVTGNNYKLNLTMLGINIAIILLLTLIVSILPILSMKKYEPVELLKEESK